MNTQDYIDYPKSQPLKHLNQTNTQRHRHGHRNRILIQLEEVYSSALNNGSYPSALKAVELNIKMLNLMESPQAPIKMDDINDETMKNLFQDINNEYGDFSLSDAYPKSAHRPSPNFERKSAHKHKEEPEASQEERRMEPPPKIQPQIQPQVSPPPTKKPPLPRLSSLGLNDLQSMLAEVNQMEARLSSPGTHCQNTPKPKENSSFPSLASLNIDEIEQLIKETEEDMRFQTPLAFAGNRKEFCAGKSVPKADMFRGPNENGYPSTDVDYGSKENTQPKFQAGQQLKNKPG